MTPARRDKLSISQNILMSEIAGEAVILSLETERYFTLNGSGTRMWEALNRTGSIEATVRELLGHYEVDESTLRQDVEAFVEALVAAKLVEVEGSNA